MIRNQFRLICELLIFMIFITACSSTGASVATPTPIPPIEQYEKAVFTVERGPIISEQQISGAVVPSRQDELFFRNSGFVTRVTVKEGDIVKAGDLMAEMQVDDLLNQLEQARIDLEVAQSNLQNKQEEQKYAVQRAQIDVNVWQDRVDLANLELSNSYVGPNRDRAQINLDIAQQNLALSELALQQAQESASPYEEQAVQRNQLAVQRLESLLDERRIVAPYDGIVLRTAVKPGQSIEAYTVAFRFGDPSDLVVRSQWDIDLSQELNKNTEVYLSPTSESTDSYLVSFLPNFLPVGDKATETTSFTNDYFYFSIPKDVPEGEFQVGRTVSLNVIIGRKDDALLLPPAAIRSYRGQYFVIVLDGDRRRRVEIFEIGLKAVDRWEVDADLNVGDQVLGP